jgi:hypothetical protein
VDPIPDIQVRPINTFFVPVRPLPTEFSLPSAPPVTVIIGIPVVDMPGCVEWHPDDRRAGNLPIEDENGVKTLCPNGQYPSFNAMDYTPEDLIYTSEAPPPAYKSSPPPEAPETKVPEIPKEEVPCPGPNAPRIGDVAQNQKEKVSGFKLNEDKTICITLYEDIGVVEQFLPSPQVVATTATIATVATTSALLAKPLADLLLKVVKPAVKKAIGTIQTKLGRKPRKLTLQEVRANRYREKRGLLPLKELKMKQGK